MKFQKTIYFSLLLLTLTGCSVDYNLDIDKNMKLNETTKLTAKTSGEALDIEAYNQYLPIDISMDDYSIYEKKYDDIEYYKSEKSNNNRNLKFNYSYNLNQFNQNKIARTCYQYITSMNNNNKLVLSTSKEFLCFDKFDNLDEVTVKITSRYKLVETNADRSTNHTYIWNINKQNYKDRSIYLSLDTTDRKETWFEKFQKTGFYQYGIIIVLFPVAFLIYRFFKKYSNKRDEI